MGQRRDVVNDWRKPSFSGPQGGCPQWRITPDGVEIRDSKTPDGPVLCFTFEGWVSFTAAVKLGEADLVPWREGDRPEGRWLSPQG
jgi:hypothetical protein